MKSLKKTLVLLVVFSMILSTLVPAFAATDVADLDCEDQVTRMEALGVITGFEDGTFRPNETITRAQMAVIICKMLGINEASAKANESVASKFSDVAANEWYTGWINIASNNGVIAGFPDGTFRPNETLTLNQVLTLCVKALGRGGYVDKMGTWPANYVTEAARLNLLKDVKGASDANRGTVAVICWNTLNAPTWYVNSENLEGEVSLSDGVNTKSLLAINFNEYTVEKAAGDFLAGDLKQTEDDVLVEATPATKATIGDRQIVLSLTDNQSNIVTKYAAFDFESAPKKAKRETATYKTDDNKVVAYVPEDVCEDLDSLKGYKVSVVFGEDNVVALIAVEDDVVEKEYITAYDADEHKITVGGTTYKLAMNEQKTAEVVKVVLNGHTENNYTLANALKAVVGQSADLEDIEKNIEATLTMNEDDRVVAIDLFTSATITNISYEGLVTEVKETSKKYTIYTADKKDISWEIEREDDEDLPRVYIDGVRGDIRDIEAGNVITVIGASNVSDIFAVKTVYVSTNTVTGEATKVKTANNAITIDGTIYSATSADVQMTTDELKDRDFSNLVAKDVLANEEVTLYMNVLGEYVAASIVEASEDFTFGVITFVSSNTTWEGDDEEILVKNIKIMLEDGSNKTFKIKADTSDEDVKDANLDKAVTKLDETYEGRFVMVAADTNNVILVEDGKEILFVEKDGNNVVTKAIKYENSDIALYNVTVADDDYDFVVVDGTAAVDGKVFIGKDTKEYTCTSNTVIFNKNSGNEEIVPKWTSILAKDNNGVKKVTGNAIAVFENKDDEALYIVVDLADYTSSDAEYAIVDSKLDEVADQEFRIDFVGQSDVEVKNESGIKSLLGNIKGWFIKYTMASDKVNSAKKLIDVDEFEALDTDKEVVLGENGVINNPAEEKYKLADVLANGGYTKAHLEVEEISVDTDYASIKYVDGIENVGGLYTEENGTYSKATSFVKGEPYYAIVNAGTPELKFKDATTYWTEENDGYAKVTTAYDAEEDYKKVTGTIKTITGADLEEKLYTKNGNNDYTLVADAATISGVNYFTIVDVTEPVTVEEAVFNAGTCYTLVGDNYVKAASWDNATAYSKVTEGTPTFKFVTKVYTNDGSDNYTKATNYADATIYYTVDVEDAKLALAEAYCLASSETYTEVAANTEYDSTKTYYTAVTTDVDTLGRVRLDDESLVVIDLRNGEVERISLEDLVDEEGKVVTGIYAVLYANEECDRAANVVIILD